MCFVIVLIKRLEKSYGTWIFVTKHHADFSYTLFPYNLLFKDDVLLCQLSSQKLHTNRRINLC